MSFVAFTLRIPKAQEKGVSVSRLTEPALRYAESQRLWDRLRTAQIEYFLLCQDLGLNHSAAMVARALVASRQADFDRLQATLLAPNGHTARIGTDKLTPEFADDESAETELNLAVCPP